MKKQEPMEMQIFDWDGWDQHDTMVFGFSDVVLKVKVGQYEPGTKFEFANVDYERSIMEFYDGNGDEPAIKLRMKLELLPLE